MSQSTVTDKSSRALGLGVIGLGGFARFALQHFIQVPGTRLVCVGGATSDEAKHCADRYGAPVLDSVEAVCQHPDVDWVYINTPPFLHADQAEMALSCGKNVLVEKPLATSLDDAERITQLAIDNGCQLVTNLMQRYNPIVQSIQTILAEKLFGEPLFFNFNNHAVDQGLPSTHWFWDRQKSGGIFIEHGVHFFDMARYWFGDGRVTSAGRHCRASDSAEDQVWCDCLFGNTVARFYHGFNQTSRTESQRWEIVCERGQITMDGWIPMGYRGEAILSEKQTKRLMEIEPDLRCRVVEQYSVADRMVHGHGTDFDVFQKISFQMTAPIPKSELYGDLLVDLFRDKTQPNLASASGDTTPPSPAEVFKGGLESLRMAVDATQRSLSK